MEQIAVVKIVKNKNGEIRRNMFLDKKSWEHIVKNGSQDADTIFELRKPEIIISKEFELINKNVKEVELIAKIETPKEIIIEEPKAEIEPEQIEKRQYKKRKQ